MSAAPAAAGKVAGSAIEAVTAALMAPFARVGATKEVRAGITRAAVRLLRSMKRPLRERYAGLLREALLGGLAQSQEKRPPHANPNPNPNSSPHSHPNPNPNPKALSLPLKPYP